MPLEIKIDFKKKPLFYIVIMAIFFIIGNTFSINYTLSYESQGYYDQITMSTNSKFSNISNQLISEKFLNGLANWTSNCKSIVDMSYFSYYDNSIEGYGNLIGNQSFVSLYVVPDNDTKRLALMYEDNEYNGVCKSFDTSGLSQCFEYFENQSFISCSTGMNSHYDDDDSNAEQDQTDELELDSNLFSERGLLLADTKFDKQYDFELTNPIDNNENIRLSLDFSKHTQSNNKDINSPRLEIVRETIDGQPNMSVAKNQTITWQGNIGEYFDIIDGKFKNETYITFHFNTGHHGSKNDDEERGFGVLFDVSATSNPDLFQYRDDGEYTKFDYDQIKELAGDNMFIFHHLDKKGKPAFINNLTNKENVSFKVNSILIEHNDTRIVETYIDDGSGKVIPYWTLRDLSKLKEHEKVDNENAFIETLRQGSGYVIARTDNIDTRVSMFQSLVF